MRFFLEYINIFVDVNKIEKKNTNCNTTIKNLRTILDLCLKITSPIIATTTVPETTKMHAEIPEISPTGTGIVAIGVA